MQHGFHGSYRRVAPKEYLAHASMASQIEKIQLSADAMFRHIQQIYQEEQGDGET